MAASKLNAVVAKALFDVQVETLDNFRDFLATKDDVDTEFMNELIDEFKASLKAPKVSGKALGKTKGKKVASDTDVEKTKRAPSAYQMFIQYNMQEFKKNNPDVKSGKNLLAKAVEAWGELSDAHKQELKDMLKADPNLTSEQLVTRVVNTKEVPSPTLPAPPAPKSPEQELEEAPAKPVKKMAASKKKTAEA